MEISLDCLPCMLKQVLEASRMASDDEKTQALIMNEAIGILSDYRKYACSPDLAAVMHRTVKKYTEVADPYRQIKEKDMQSAEKIVPFLKLFLNDRQDKLYWALKIAATGNIIDSAVYGSVDIENVVEKELMKRFAVCDSDSFSEKLKKAKTLLMIGDNAGETFFDRVLAEYLAPLHIYYAVRSGPVINDAGIPEALRSGLGECADVVSSGCDSPGAVLEKCSPEFTELFQKADIVVSKGQGNFEALSGCKRNIFFLLKAKCSVIAKRLGVDLNEYVFLENGKE